jgi:hypothetical protein
MPTPLSALADRAVHAADVVRDLVDEAERLAAIIRPPLELYAAARALEKWSNKLRGNNEDDHA